MEIDLKADGSTYDDLAEIYNKAKSIMDEGPTYKEVINERYVHKIIKKFDLGVLLETMNDLGEEGYKAEGSITNYYDNGGSNTHLQLMVKKETWVEKIQVSSWSRMSDTQSSVYNLETFVCDGWVEKGYVDSDDELIFLDDENNLLTKKGIFEVEDDFEDFDE